MRFPESADTRVWFTPDALLVEERCDVEHVRPTCGVRVLSPDVDNASLGAEIVRSLTSIRERTWADMDEELRAFNKAYPELDQFSDRYHSVVVLFRAQQTPESIKLDGRAAQINKPNRILIPVGSSDAELGAAVRISMVKRWLEQTENGENWVAQRMAISSRRA
jgi:hypothetical protein